MQGRGGAEWAGSHVSPLPPHRCSGHNELDQPMFTQPVLYSTIAKHKSALDLFSARLAAEVRRDATVGAIEKR